MAALIRFGSSSKFDHHQSIIIKYYPTFIPTHALDILIVMYARSLVEVGRLIYLIGNYNETVQVKKILESNEGK
jgi:hypothetical protein